MDVPRCETCKYARRPTSRLLRLALHRFPGLLICFRCAESDGQMTGVSPGGTCRNYRKRRKPPTPSEPMDKPGNRRKRRTPKVQKECRIPLSKDLFALVDPEDFEKLSRHTWFAIGKSPHIYAVRHEKGRFLYMHREITKAPGNRFVDHINCDTLDNTRDNLRLCTRRQNHANTCSRRGSSRFVGVSRHGDKWMAYINWRGKHYHLGLFDDEVEAAKARDRKAWELHGEFAYLNFPEDYGR
ncbi:MAG: HNH endonuclease [Phycisphaerales bacterium]